MSVSKPDKIEFTLEVTMSLKEWKELSAQMKNEWPASELRNNIDSMVTKASSIFWPQ